MDTPAEQTPANPTPTGPHQGRKDSILGGVILVVLGLLFLARNLIPGFDFSEYWPVILIAIGIALIVRSRQS